MTGLVAFSVALISFIAGMVITLLIIALVFNLKEEEAAHDTGADEGDQTSFRQRGPFPSGS